MHIRGMSEFIFRAKNRRGKWEFGDLRTAVKADDRMIVGISEEEPFCIYEVDPETVCQFSGLKDSEGVNIYEGDIIASCFADYKAVVEFRNGAFVAVTGPVDTYQTLYGVLRLKGLRVIGNVFDNPELIR